MLVLSRRKNEAIVIGQGIVVTVLSIKGSRVRLGINAPPEVPVHREEVGKRIELEVPLVQASRVSVPTLTVCP